MRQSGEALIRKFGFGRAQHAAYIDSVLRRFRNPWLRDTVARVGHDPARKLSAPLYFSYPITLAAGYGLAVDKLALAAAAALRFDDPADGQCAEIRRRSPGSVCRLPCGGLPASTTTGSWRRWSTLMRGCRRPSGRDGRVACNFS